MCVCVGVCAFVEGFVDVRELPGVGEYAARTYEIFCKGDLGDVPPADHSLVKYWNWARNKRKSIWE